MARFRRAVALLVTLGTLLSLSACGTSVPAAVGSYRATFVLVPIPGAPPSGLTGKLSVVYSLVLSSNGHFVMTSHVGSLNGTWSEARDHVRLTGVGAPAGVDPSKFVLMARLKDRNLLDGTLDLPGQKPSVAYTPHWSAVRTG